MRSNFYKAKRGTNKMICRKRNNNYDNNIQRGKHINHLVCSFFSPVNILNNEFPFGAITKINGKTVAKYRRRQKLNKTTSVLISTTE
jgi:hypothetical protein